MPPATAFELNGLAPSPPPRWMIARRPPLAVFAAIVVFVAGVGVAGAYEPAKQTADPSKGQAEVRATTDSKTASTRRAIAAYRGMSAERRIAWLEHLLRERIERAAGWVELPQEQAARAAYHDEALARVRAGRMLSDGGLEKLLGDACMLEAAAIERLAAAYDKAVAGAFAADARGRDLRLEAWRRVQASWRGAGARDEDRPLLVNWLAEAIGRLEGGHLGHLPARPRFDVPSVEPANVARSGPASAPPTQPPTIVSAGKRHVDSSAAAPATPPAPAAPTRALADAHGIDSRELDDRLHGYRVSLAGLNGHLQANAVSSAAELNRVVEDLEEIVVRRGDLLLYVRLISPESERAKLASPAAALSLVSSKISAARLRVQSEPEKETDPRQELDRLADLSRRVADVATRLQQQCHESQNGE